MARRLIMPMYSHEGAFVSEAAIENKKSTIDVEGFDSLLEVQEATLVEVQELDHEEVQEPAASVLEGYWTTDEAAKELGLSQRTIFKRLKDGSLTGFRVKGKFKKEWRIKPISPTRKVIEAVPEVQESDTEPSGTDKKEAQEALQEATANSSRSPKVISDLDKLLTLIQEKDRQLQAATFRNGYLEAQLEGKEREIKLLTDSQHKTAGWRKLWSWFTGR